MEFVFVFVCSKRKKIEIEALRDGRQFFTWITASPAARCADFNDFATTLTLSVPSVLFA